MIEICSHHFEDDIYNIWQNEHEDSKLLINEHLRYYQLQSMIPEGVNRLIDVGCGTGYMDYLLSRAGLRVTAVDISVERLELFRDIAEKNNIRQINRSLFDLDLNGFDAILSQEVLEHLEEPEKALAKMAALIKPGGYGLFCVPYRENLEAKMITCALCGERFHKNGHLHSFSEQKLADFVTSAGFKVLRLKLIVNKRSKKWFAAFGEKAVNVLPLIKITDDLANKFFPHKAAYLACLCQRAAA